MVESPLLRPAREEAKRANLSSSPLVRRRAREREQHDGGGGGEHGVVREVLGSDVVEEVDQAIIDYIANVLADEDFDFSVPDGHDIFEALGELLIDSGCVSGQDHCLQIPMSWKKCLLVSLDQEICGDPCIRDMIALQITAPG